MRDGSYKLNQKDAVCRSSLERDLNHTILATDGSVARLCRDRRTMTISQRLLKFVRIRLGLKPLIDYAQARSRLIGVAELPIRTVFDIGANVGKKARQ